MKVANKRQRPSVKRLKKRRVELDSIKQKIHEAGLNSLGSKQREFYDEQKIFDNQSFFQEIAAIIKNKGLKALTEEQREGLKQYKVRCRVASLMRTDRASDIISKEEKLAYKDLLKLAELNEKIQRSGIKKLSKEERALYDSHLENKRKWR